MNPASRQRGVGQCLGPQKIILWSYNPKEEKVHVGFRPYSDGITVLQYCRLDRETKFNIRQTVSTQPTTESICAVSKKNHFIGYNSDKLLEEQIKGEIDPISSGLYKLVTIESRFQGGRFTQTLNGYKDVNSNTALLLPKIIELSGV